MTGIIFSFIVAFIINNALFVYTRRAVISMERKVFILIVCYAFLDFFLLVLNKNIVVSYFMLPSIFDMLLVYLYFLSSFIFVGIINALIVFFRKKRLYITYETTLLVHALSFLREMFFAIVYVLLTEVYFSLDLILLFVTALAGLLLIFFEKRIVEDNIDLLEMIRFFILNVYYLVLFLQTYNLVVTAIFSLIVKFHDLFLKKSKNKSKVERGVGT